MEVGCMFGLIWLLGFGCMAVTIPIYLIKVRGIFVTLESEHPEAWSRLGSPSLFLNNSPRNSFLFVRWLIGFEYELLDDKKLSAACDSTRTLLLISLVSWLATMISSIFIFTD